MKYKLSGYKDFFRKFLIVLGGLVGLYLLIGAYFLNHFFIGTKVNSVSISGKSLKKSQEEIKKEFHKYSLTLKGRDGEEKIIGEEFGFAYDSHGELNNLMKSQNPLKWITGIFNKSSSTLEIISFNEYLLKEKYLNLFNKDIVKPQNPKIKYSEGKYIIEPEVLGNEINRELLYEIIFKGIKNGEKLIDIEESGAYINPKYTENSPEVVEGKNILDKYISTNITYRFGEWSENLGHSIINHWLTVDEDFNVIINKKKVSEYVNELGDTYDTYEGVRRFKTSTGKIVDVVGGTYGWLINISKETDELVELIKEGTVAEREPVYIQKAIRHGEDDIGNTYVEINMTTQSIWFYKDGKLVVSGDVVTGNITRNHPTPTGTFGLNYKQKNATLKGENYSAPVNYWMPFYGNVGIHDATWRNSFGGNIYRSNGSHGCVNAPLYVAKTIFENIEPGTPIISYYDR